MPKPLTGEPKEILLQLIDGIEKSGDSKIINNADGLFYPVKVMFGRDISTGPVYILANIDVANGIEIYDPGVFVQHNNNDKEYYVVGIQNDNLGGGPRKATEDDRILQSNG